MDPYLRDHPEPFLPVTGIGYPIQRPEALANMSQSPVRANDTATYSFVLCAAQYLTTPGIAASTAPYGSVPGTGCTILRD
jgi:hypothetical protein